MTLKKEIEFNNIVNDILKNQEFIDLKYEIHHGISRLEHSLNVARMTYNICKILKIKNYNEITRASLLHDFFKNYEITKYSFINHPVVAKNNAQKVFNINDFQSNIIESHMFPVSYKLPKNIGAWVVLSSDKIVAIYECMKFKIPLTIGAAFLFFINASIIQR